MLVCKIGWVNWDKKHWKDKKPEVKKKKYKQKQNKTKQRWVEESQLFLSDTVALKLCSVPHTLKVGIKLHLLETASPFS